MTREAVFAGCSWSTILILLQRGHQKYTIATDTNIIGQKITFKYPRGECEN